MAAAAVAALLYLPARERLSEFANRLVHGERQAPTRSCARSAAGSPGHPHGRAVAATGRVAQEDHGPTAAEVWTGTGGVVERTVSVPGDRPKRRIELGEKEQPVVARRGVGQRGPRWLPALLDGRDDVGHPDRP